MSLLLISQVALFYALPKNEAVLLSKPLQDFPAAVNGWTMLEQGVLEREILDLLKADDTLSRVYADPSGLQRASLFVAYFKSQRAGVTPHSPKVCLPGSGWIPLDSRVIGISVADVAAPVQVNRYTVARGEQRSVVIYWYQTHNRVVANEYAAKLYLMVDSVRYRRSDTSLVRVVVPVIDGQDEVAHETAVRFVQEIFNPLRRFLPARSNLSPHGFPFGLRLPQIGMGNQ